MSLFDAARNRKRGEDAKQRVLERVYSPKEEESTKEDMFSGVRNRSLNVETATPEPVVSKEPTAASQVLKITLDGVLSPSPVATKKQETKQETKKNQSDQR